MKRIGILVFFGLWLLPFFSNGQIIVDSKVELEDCQVFIENQDSIVIITETNFNKKGIAQVWSRQIKKYYEVYNGNSHSDYAMREPLRIDLEIREAEIVKRIYMKHMVWVYPSTYGAFVLYDEDQIRTNSVIGCKLYSLYQNKNKQLEQVKVWTLGNVYWSSPEIIYFTYTNDGQISEITLENYQQIDQLIEFPKGYQGVNGRLTKIYEYDDQGSLSKEFILTMDGKKLIRTFVGVKKSFAIISPILNIEKPKSYLPFSKWEYKMNTVIKSLAK